MTTNRLLVEGVEDKRVLPELLERAGLPWGQPGRELVRIHAVDGFQNFTTAEVRAQLKGSIERLALVVDADEAPDSRWLSLRSRLEDLIPVLPSTLPSGGLVLEIPSGGVPVNSRLRRFGIWMMPDNGAQGMLETFLLSLRSEADPAMFSHVERATDCARELGELNPTSNVFKRAHRDKALVHTWLAWHGDPPGRQLHQAVKERLFDATCAAAVPFVAWFKRVFELA